MKKTGINLAASNRDREVAAHMSLNMGTGKQREESSSCALSWFGNKNVTLAVKVACSKIFSSLPKRYTNHGEFYAHLNLSYYLAQVRHHCHTLTLPVRCCDHSDAICIAQNDCDSSAARTAPSTAVPAPFSPDTFSAYCQTFSPTKV